MEIPKFSAGYDNFYKARIIENENPNFLLREFMVKLRSLDSLSRLFMKKDIAFIKIDLEGHEFQVVDGAKEMIKYSRPALLIEISENPDDIQSSAFMLFDRLKKEGYSCYWYDGSELKQRSRGDKSVNYFFLTDEQINQYISNTAKI